MKYLKIENLKSKIYYEPLTILFHSCFQVLKDYVEEEMEIYDFCLKEFHDHDEETIQAMKESFDIKIDTYDKIIDLYHWYEEWIKKDNLTYDDEQIENDKLKELIDIRLFLWS